MLPGGVSCFLPAHSKLVKWIISILFSVACEMTAMYNNKIKQDNYLLGYISEAMQNHSVSLNSHTMLHPLGNMVKYNDSLVRNLMANLAENFKLSHFFFIAVLFLFKAVPSMNCYL